MSTITFSRNKEETITVPTFNLALTPLTYTAIIGEVLKCLIYEKSQIPYPFHYLEHIITTKRTRLAQDEGCIKNYAARKQFKLAMRAYDYIKEIINCMKTIFSCNDSSNIKEVIVLFGANTFSVKEIYTFVVPQFASGHIERNHSVLTNTYQHNILRSIFMSKEWISKMEIPLLPTNFHFALKLSEARSIVVDDKTFESFSTTSSIALRHAPNLKVNFLFDTNIVHNCCNNLSVYEDKVSSENNEKVRVTEVTNTDKGFPIALNDRAPIIIDNEYMVFKNVWSGFKEKFVNKVPVLESC